MTIYKAIHCKVAMSRKQYTYNHRANPDCNKPFMMNVETRESCRELFKEINILPLQSQYILSLLLFVVKNINMFKSNSVVHTINTGHCSDLYLPSVHLSKVQKGVYHSAVKVFNCLPPRIKSLSTDVRKFKAALKRFLLEGSYYTIHEYFESCSLSNPSIFL